jgi:hypothetical protein
MQSKIGPLISGTDSRCLAVIEMRKFSWAAIVLFCVLGFMVTLYAIDMGPKKISSVESVIITELGAMPGPLQLTCCDMYLDGGSIGCSFTDASGREYSYWVDIHRRGPRYRKVFLFDRVTSAMPTVDVGECPLLQGVMRDLVDRSGAHGHRYCSEMLRERLLYKLLGLVR